VEYRPGKPGKVRKIEIGHGNREKSGKKSGISKFAYNFLKLLLFQIIGIYYIPL